MGVSTRGMSLKTATVIVLCALALVGTYAVYPRGLSPLQEYPELEELSSKPAISFQELSNFFEQLSEKKGAPYAYQVLLRATLPPGTDLHLLGHVVGNMLYRQQGIRGINTCTADFRNACSHSVVIGILLEHGEGALSQIAEACKKAPGGRGSYTMCFHGLGHGVLAFTGYDLERAIAMCRRTGTPEYRDREYIECVGGAVMEMTAGVHNPEVWKKQVGKYFKDVDPLYPCDAAFMPDVVKPICYIHLTPHLFTAAGMDLSKPDPNLFKTSFSYCAAIPPDAPALRDACYGGFGKEFVVLAEGRDVRNIGMTKESSLRNVHAWCAFAHNEAGEDQCNSYALASLFWGGENNPDAAFEFCALAEGEAQNHCYRELSGHVGYYFSGSVRGFALCNRFPREYKEMCVNGVRLANTP